jgi:hypothetical protein
MTATEASFEAWMRIMTERFDVPIEALLRRKATDGLIVAVLLTVFLVFCHGAASGVRNRRPPGYPSPMR